MSTKIGIATIVNGIFKYPTIANPLNKVKLISILMVLCLAELILDDMILDLVVLNNV